MTDTINYRGETFNVAYNREPYPGWSCADCITLIANGEMPGHMTDTERADFTARFEIGTTGTGGDITPGMLRAEHTAGCPNGDQITAGTADCDCETITFSGTPCTTCGSRLAGERHAVTLWM